ncbi:hypothetical protein GCM10010327_46870 [Streptomyces nitrosporeus]|nr:hypothetical protein GCM10010327_46870 [Streptomyces nitrosporeus]
MTAPGAERSERFRPLERIASGGIPPESPPEDQELYDVCSPRSDAWAAARDGDPATGGFTESRGWFPAGR